MSPFLQTVHLKQPEISFCQRDGFFVDIGADHLVNVLCMQIRQYAEMICCAAAGIVQHARSGNSINCFAMRNTTLKYFTRQPYWKSWVPRQTVKHPPAGK